MPRTELERTVLPSVLDRLTDDDPQTPADPPITREESIRRYRNAVLRDVEWLLNTRRTAILVPDGMAALRRSAFMFGLPDTTTLAPGTAEGRDQLVRWVAQTIETFEPRLVNVQVTCHQADQINTPQVRFVVAALLRMDPSPEQVLFDTVLDIASGGYVVHAPGAGA